MPRQTIKPSPGYSVPVDIMAGRAVRARIRRRWEKRRAETAGRSELFSQLEYLGSIKEEIIPSDYVYMLPGRPAKETPYGTIPARPERPRTRIQMERLSVRLVQPR